MLGTPELADVQVLSFQDDAAAADDDNNELLMMVITWILTIISVPGIYQLQSWLWWKKARTARTCIITITSINKYKAAIWIFINHEHNTWPLNTATISSLFTEVQLRLHWLGEKPECNGQGLSLSAWPVLSTGLQPLAGLHLEKRHPGQVRITRDIPV